MRSPIARNSAALLLALVLAACAGKPPPPKAAAPGATVKIGKPYQVFGVWYYPTDDRSYDQRGIASWYGPGFHALSTANGERYDQDDVTAAHKTLPMPSYVEVENLDNGRRLVVRINDRGPFVAGRIIDLSRKSAQLLGVDRVGTARVRVRRVFPNGKEKAPVIAAAATQRSPPPPIMAPPQVVASATPTIADPVIRTVDLPPTTPSGGTHFIQVAALADPGRVAWLKGFMSAFGPVVTETTSAGLTRIRLGPFSDAESAQAALAKVRVAGYSEARLLPPTP
jgi:rare lipoprotein A